LSRSVRVNAGKKSVTLPNGRTYDGQVDVTLSQADFDRISPTAFTGGAPLLTDLGHIADPDIDADFLTPAEGNAAYARVGPSTVTAVKTGAYVASAGEVVPCNATGGAFNVTLPAAAAGRWVTVKKIDASANAVTVVPPAGTIDGAANHPITTQWASRDFVSDGTTWYVV
jgi:hypothetical protein